MSQRLPSEWSASNPHAPADVAAASTVEQFAKRVGLEARRLERDDGMDRLRRQRCAARLRSFVDGDGMWNLRD